MGALGADLLDGGECLQFDDEAHLPQGVHEKWRIPLQISCLAQCYHPDVVVCHSALSSGCPLRDRSVHWAKWWKGTHHVVYIYIYFFYKHLCL